MGNLLSVDIHAANIHDTTSGIDAAYEAFEKYPTIEAFCGDEGYRGTFIDDVDYYIGVPVNISERIAPKFVVQPKRWVVERTFAWLGLETPAVFQKIMKSVPIQQRRWLKYLIYTRYCDGYVKLVLY